MSKDWELSEQVINSKDLEYTIEQALEHYD